MDPALGFYGIVPCVALLDIYSLLNIVKELQVCDATMYHSNTAAWPQRENIIIQ